MMELHFSYILESEIKEHSEWSQTMLLNFKYLPIPEPLVHYYTTGSDQWNTVILNYT